MSSGERDTFCTEAWGVCVDFRRKLWEAVLDHPEFCIEKGKGLIAAGPGADV